MDQETVAYPLPQRLLDALITRAPHQRLRLTMTGLAALLMLCCIVAMHLVAAAGLTQAQPVYWWTLACVTGLVVVYVLIRSGVSSRWRDPALTLPQIVYAIACNASAYVIAGPARGIALPILAVILMFGIFGLTPGQMVGVLLYGLVAFSVASAVVQWWYPPSGQPAALAWAYMVMIVVVLISSTFLNMRVHATREKLRQQKSELARAVEQVRELATRDELTGLHNRRYMLGTMRLESLRVQRAGHCVLVAQLDLDHFKSINDTHGHGAGDRALQAFAQTVLAHVRATDILARWGGEEFVLLMAGTPPEEGARLLERVRAAIAASPVALPTGNLLQLTVSIGAARLRSGETPEGVLQRADAALYAAKRQGRNQIVWAQQDAPDSIAFCA